MPDGPGGGGWGSVPEAAGLGAAVLGWPKEKQKARVEHFQTKVCALGEARDQKNKNALLSNSALQFLKCHFNFFFFFLSS